MAGIKASDIVRSIAGRDKDRLLYVLDTDDGCVYVADGKIRRVRRPKRKNLKHVAHEAGDESQTALKIRAGDRVTDKEIRGSLAVYRATRQEMTEEGI